jgi:hypothetical protein
VSPSTSLGRDDRYAQEADDGSFDWCKTYADIKHLVNRFVPNKDVRIVMLGCGNSSASDRLSAPPVRVNLS